MPDGRENIPHLLGELLPRATFFTQVVNQGILGHYVANASLATGAYETINNFIAAPPQHPTVFEYFRKELKRPASDVWVIAPSIGFERIGESRHCCLWTGTGSQRDSAQAPAGIGGAGRRARRLRVAAARQLRIPSVPAGSGEAQKSNWSG